MIQHKDQASGKWFARSLMEQLANVGTDIERAIRWKNKGNLEYSQHAFERALELLWFTIEDPKNKGRLKELCRMKETLIDYFMGNNIYRSTDESWQRYFYAFNYAAAMEKGR